LFYITTLRLKKKKQKVSKKVKSENIDEGTSDYEAKLLKEAEEKNLKRKLRERAKKKKSNINKIKVLSLIK